MKIPCRRLITCLLPGLLLGSQLLAAASQPVYALNAADWARPRSAATVLALTPVSAAVQDWRAAPTRHMLIRYPADEAGELWAGELTDWLVSLGVPHAQLRSQPGAPPGKLLLGVE